MSQYPKIKFVHTGRCPSSSFIRQKNKWVTELHFADGQNQIFEITEDDDSATVVKILIETAKAIALLHNVKPKHSCDPRHISEIFDAVKASRHIKDEPRTCCGIDFKTYIDFEDDGKTDVYEEVNGDIIPRGDIDDCEGENIVATFDAWKRSGYSVNKGETAAFRSSGKVWFHWSQVNDSSNAGYSSYPDDFEDYIGEDMF